MAQQARLELLADSSQIKTATKDLQSLEVQGGRTEKGVTGFSRSLNKASNSTAIFGRNAGQAGIQVQQFVGQVQGGQSALLALSQQGADLGIVLGAPLVGVVISLGAALAATLAPSLMQATSSAEELEEAIALLDQTAENSDGVSLLSERILKLAERSEALARIEISKGILDSQNAIDTAIQSINSGIADSDQISRKALNNIAQTLDQLGLSAQQVADDGINYLGQNLDSGRVTAAEYSTSLNNLRVVSINLDNEYSRLNRTLGLNEEQATKLIDAYSRFQIDQDVTSAQNFQAVLGELNDDFSSGNERLTEFSSQFTAAFAAIFRGVEQTNDLRVALGDITGAIEQTTEATSDSTSKTERFLIGLEGQRIAIEDGEVAARLYAAAIATGAGSVLDLDENVRANVISLYAAEEAVKAEADAVVEAEKRKAEARREAAKEQAKNERDRGRFESFSAGLDRSQLSFESPIDQAQAQLAERLRIASEYRANEIISDQEFIETQLQAWDLFEKRKTEITEQEEENRNKVKTRAQNQELSATASFLGAMAQLAAGAGEKQFENYKKLAVAETVISTYSSAQKAYDSLAGIPYVGPFLGAAAAATAIAIGLQRVSSIKSQEYSGARALGGQVLGGNQYLVGERGPEVISMNSSGNGNVTPFNQLMSEARGTGGGNVTNNDTFNFNFQEPSDSFLSNWIANNTDLIYGAVRRAKQRQGQKF